MISLEKFHLFYEENKKKLPIKQSGRHSVDNEKFTTWINRQGEDDSSERIFADLLRKYTRYVPYSEFYEKIERIAADAHVLMSTYKPKNVIILILGITWNEPIKKSPVWVGLLYYGLLQEKVTHILTDIREAIQLAKTEKTLCIIAEDASYTGSQLKSFIGNISMDVETKKNMEFFLGAPYISKKARSTIKSALGSCYISSVTDIFHTIKDNVSDEPSAVKEIVKKSKGYSDIAKSYTIYFDHKLADSYSIIQSIYALGRDLSSENRSDKVLTLINNCDYSEYDLDPTQVYSDIQTKISASKMCPSPIYKLIDYTYEGKSITSFFPLI